MSSKNKLNSKEKLILSENKFLRGLSSKTDSREKSGASQNKINLKWEACSLEIKIQKMNFTKKPVFSDNKFDGKACVIRERNSNKRSLSSFVQQIQDKKLPSQKQKFSERGVLCLFGKWILDLEKKNSKTKLVVSRQEACYVV